MQDSERKIIEEFNDDVARMAGEIIDLRDQVETANSTIDERDEEISGLQDEIRELNEK